MATEPTLRAVLDAIQATLDIDRPAGDDWFTVAELARQAGITNGAMRGRLARARERGLSIEAVAAGGNRVVYYRLPKA